MKSILFPSMSRTHSHEPFRVSYRTQITSIIRCQHVYMDVWCATEGEGLEAAPDMRKEVKDYDKYVVGVYKENLLVGHIPTEISSLCFHFL